MRNSPQGKGLTVAVTGARGFIGHRLVEILGGQGAIAEIRLLARNRAPSLEANGAKSKTIALRLDDPAAMDIALAGCDAVVHCAFDFDEMGRNLPILKVLAAACERHRVRLIQISSAAVHEPFPDGELDESAVCRPSGVAYRDTKIALETEIREQAGSRGLDAVILRPTVVYGPSGRAWTDAPIRDLLTGKVVLPDDGQGLCNALYIDDLCQAILAALTADLPSGEAFLISGAAPVTWREFFAAYQTILGVDSLRFPPGLTFPRATGDGAGQPAPISGLKAVLKGNGAVRLLRRWAAGMLDHDARAKIKTILKRVKAGRGEIIHHPSASQMALYSARCAVRIDKARRMLGYHPRHDLEQGMALTAPYIRTRFAAGHDNGRFGAANSA